MTAPHCSSVAERPPRRAKRSLGQNFLVDPNIQRKIIDALEPSAHDEVIEIGPGTGALTRRLAGTVGRLIAIEKDDALARELDAELKASRCAAASGSTAADAGVCGTTIVNADAMDLDLGSLVDSIGAAKVVGNIPYNLTTPLLFKLLEPGRRAARLVIMVQKEVAERITARAGEPEYGALTVGIRSVADVESLFVVGRGAFRPAPRVDSAVLRITPHRPPRLEPDEERDLRALTRATFGWRRKQLQRTLRDATDYRLDAREVDALAERTGLDLARRPETLTPDDFIALGRALRAAGRPTVHFVTDHDGR